jgi:uncharacterized protein (TIGR02594 family)
MPIDPSNYAWLDNLGPLPRMIVEARKLVGIQEAPGVDRNNPVILGWAREVGGTMPSIFPRDSVPWCGLFMAVVAKRAGKTAPPDAYWALNWSNFGTPAGQPVLGDVLTFIRRTRDGKTAGHVALYIGEDDTDYHVLGGNQGDQVCFDRIDKARLRAERRTPYSNMPASAKPYYLAAIGSRSAGEE